MTKIIAIANHKGGVGKTTTTATVGAILAQRGYKVLLIDLDAQANLTSSLTNEEPQRTIYHAFHEQKNLPVIPVSDNLHLVPSSLELAGIELEIAGLMSREFILKDLLDKLGTTYDYILLDCPPSLGLVTLNAFVAASEIYLPLTAEALPFKGLRLITETVERVCHRLNPNLKLSGILITRWGGRRLNAAVENAVRERFGNIVFGTKISENIKLAEAPLTTASVLDYAPDCKGVRDYNALVDEMLQR